jgi:hypothetical protein
MKEYTQEIEYNLTKAGLIKFLIGDLINRDCLSNPTMNVNASVIQNTLDTYLKFNTTVEFDNKIGSDIVKEQYFTIKYLGDNGLSNIVDIQIIAMIVSPN